MIWAHFYRWRGVFFITAYFVVILLIPLAQKLEMDPSNQSIFEINTDYQRFVDFQHTFGGDDQIVLALETKSSIDQQMLEWIHEFSLEVQNWPEVDSLKSLTTLDGLERAKIAFRIKPMAAQWIAGNETAESLLNRVASQPEISSFLLSKDRKMTLLILSLKPLESNVRHESVVRLQQWLVKHPLPAVNFYLTGPVVEQDSFIGRIQRDHQFLLPITFVVMLLLIALSFRDFRAILFPGAVVIITLLSSQALMVLLSDKLNAMTLLVAPVLVIVSVSVAIHLQSRVADHISERDGKSRWQKMMKELFVPCFNTSTTTAAGFGSLICNQVPAVREFGFHTALGTLFSFCWTLMLAPIFLDYAAKWVSRPSGKTGIWEKFSAKKLIYLTKHSSKIVFAALVLLIFSLSGIYKVRNSTDILGAFKPDDPFRVMTEKVQDTMGGIYPLEVVIEGPGIDAFKSATIVKKLIEFKKKVSRLNGVSNVAYVTDLLQLAERFRLKSESVPVALNETWLKRYIKRLDQQKRSLLRTVMQDHFKKTRMTLYLRSTDTHYVQKLSDEIGHLSGYLPDEFHLDITGQSYLLAQMSQKLVKNQLQSLALSFLLIGGIMILMLKSLKWGLLAMLANLIPILLTIRLMPLLHIPLNTATVTIASISLGLIIDNAIHILYRLKHTAEVYDLTIAQSLATCVKPIVISCFVLALGFSVSCLGSIQPTIDFGILMVIVILSALVSNLVILLTLILRWGGYAYVQT